MIPAWKLKQLQEAWTEWGRVRASGAATTLAPTQASEVLFSDLAVGDHFRNLMQRAPARLQKTGTHAAVFIDVDDGLTRGWIGQHQRYMPEESVTRLGR